MENNKQSEKDIRNLLDKYQPEIDTDLVWENIEPKLKKKKRRGFIFFWLLAGAGLLGWVAYQSIGGESTPQIADNQIVKSNVVEASTSEEQPEIDSDSEKEVVDSPFREMNEQDATTFAENLSRTGFGRQKMNGNLAKANQPKVNTKQTPSVSTESVSTPILAKANYNQTRAQKSDKTNFENQTSDEEILPSKNEISAPTTEKTIPASIESVDEKTDDVEPSNATELVEAITESEEETLPTQTETKKEKGKKKKAKAKKKKRKKKKKKRRTKRLRKAPFRTYIQVFAAPEYAFNSLTAPGNEGRTSWINQRYATEKQQEAFSVGTNLQLIHKSGFVVMTGAEYRRINGQFKRVTEEEKLVLENGIISYTVNAAGDTIDTGFGLKQKIITTTTTEIANNQFQFFNIPIGLGYQQRYRNSGWKILGGLNLNIAYYMEANYLDRSGNLAPYDNELLSWRNNDFKHRADPNLWASFEYFRKIGSRTQWMIAPKIEVPTRGLTNVEEYPISQRFYPISLKAGFNFLIGKKPKEKKSKKRKKKKK